ncbi:MAG: ABC transporter permease, partial [Bryobacteraceae bacterium]
MFWRKRKSRDDDLDREIRSHLDLEAEEQQDRGLSQEDARYAAKRALGNATLVKEAVRDMRLPRWLDAAARDLRYATRMLRKNPVFSFIAVAVLALGIGGNTAIFSIANAALLRSLPFPHPHQLVELWDSYGNPGNYGPVSYPNFRDWRAWNRAFSGMAAFTNTGFDLTGAGEPMHVEAILASANLFRVLGIHPMLGRNFSPGEDRPGANGANSAIISYRLWRERFGGESSVLGRIFKLDGKPFSVVGVMPPHFDSYTGGSGADIWVTAALLSSGKKPVAEERGISFLHVIGRLRPGVSLQQAQADMSRVAGLLMRAYPKGDPKESVTVKNL